MKDHIKATIKTYNKIAPYYKITATPELRKWEEESIDRFINYLPGNLVLVPGCGDGRDSRYLISKNIHVSSFDLSAGMLNEAIKEDPNGNYFLYDIRNIININKTYDGIWASGCLYHLSNNEFNNFIMDSLSILKKSGILYLNMKEGKGSEFIDKPKSNEYPGGIESKILLTGKRYYSYYSHDELLLYFSKYKILYERELKYTEKGFEFWLMKI